MKIRRAIAGLLLMSCSAFVQQKPETQGQSQKKPSPQRVYEGPLGLPCAKILAMPSSDYIAQVVAIDDSNVDGQLRGIRAYGKCYDERTDQLSAALARKGTGPKKTAVANLKDFQAGMESFTAKTLADIEPPADPVKIAYAGLYQKQFRYEFYGTYEQKMSKPTASPKSSKPAGASSSPTPSATPDTKSPDLPPAPKQAPLTGVTTKKTLATTPAPPPATAPAPPKGPEPESATKEIDPFTKAKNHFGELLGLLPEDKVHDVHAAFGKLFSGNPVSEDLKVEVYEYAIFLLERSADKPFAPPPF